MFSSNTTQVAAEGGYQISRSLRFNSADNAYLSRTPASSSSKTTWTFSTWFKRSSLDNFQTILSAGQPSSAVYLVALFFANNNLDLAVYGSGGAQEGRVTSTAVFRDMSAWYHVMAVLDTTNATSSNRLKLYINGLQITALSTSSYPPQNSIYAVNSTDPHIMGAYSFGTTLNKIDGYQTETYLIDGQALTPSSFGETNAQTGVWQPKAYSGSYGTNGFYLNFSDNSNTTATTLGKDYSGNGNNWTPNNFSVTAGAGNDSLVDVPTPYGVDTGVGGEVRGNYATLNPLAFNSAPGGTGQSTFSNGNLQAVNNAVSWTNCFSTISMNSGKFYFEFTVLSGSADAIVGIYNVNTAVGAMSDYVGHTSSGYVYYIDGTKGTGGSFTAYGSSWTTGDIIGVALDLDAGTLVFYKNGTSQGTAFSGLSGNFVFAMTTYYTNSFKSCNFGQRPFAYTAPSGFKALCTQNLPTPTIGATTATQAGKFFNPVIYTGDGVNGRAVTGVGFQPDMVWVKGRSTVSNHVLNDVLRGGSRTLFPNTIEAEYYDPDAFVKSFTSDGFTVGSLGGVNGSGATYVGWSWKANGSGSSNTAGSITSTVSANTTSGFSIVTWTGNGADASIGHGLGVVPSMVIQKFRSAVSNWSVYTSTTGVGKRLKLNSTDAVATDGSFPTTPTSTVFYINGGSNDNGVTMVAYCFAPIAGYSAFGSYTGNGSTDGPFVFTGFRPAYVMVKATISGTADWAIHDVARNTYNVVDNTLLANLSDAEYTSNAPIDMVSNGFKIRTTNPNWNTNTGTYIYICFASNPFKYSLAR
jgi:hypothetical protein